MSERSAALGIKGPPKTIEHNGKVFTITPVLTEGIMLALEQRFYEREKAALLGAKDMYTRDEYLEQVAALREAHTSGAFAFEGARTQAFLQTEKGTLTMLGVLMTATESEVYALLTERTDEMTQILNEITADSFPEGRTPKKAKPLRAGGARPKSYRAR